MKLYRIEKAPDDGLPSFVEVIDLELKLIEITEEEIEAIVLSSTFADIVAKAILFKLSGDVGLLEDE